MDDMRQKLLPVFLKEAEKNLGILDRFLSAEEPAGQKLTTLEAAFRSAHTLKGTAALVQAESIQELGRRLEGLLERHFERSSFPSAVEYQAMRLVRERIGQLIVCVREGAEEPPSLVSEALQVLDLATGLPGRSGTVSDDPFADDPGLDLEDAESLAVSAPAGAPSEDPFADDPPLGVELATGTAGVEVTVGNAEETSDEGLKPAATQLSDDPFVEDAGFDLELEPAVSMPTLAEPSEPEPLEVALEPDEPEVSADSEPAVVTFAGVSIDDPFAEDPPLGMEMATGSSQGAEEHGPEIDRSVDVAPPVDPFAEDPAPELEVEVESAEPALADEETSVAEPPPAEPAAGLVESPPLLNTEPEIRRDLICCCFRLADDDYYLPIGHMVEITELPELVPLPMAPPFVRGLINLRGRVLPVIDLAVQKGKRSGYAAHRRLVVAEAHGEQLAFFVDGVPNLSEEFLGERVDPAEFIERFHVGSS